MKYILIDTMNTFFRARHIAAKGADAWTKAGFALHLTLSSIGKVWREQGGDHVVLCLDGGSWRTDYYKRYKLNRKEGRAARTEEQVEEDTMFFEAYDDMVQFFDKRTNCTVLSERKIEGDDFIARWIQLHPNDEHVIISSDTDFDQLLAKNVSRYNGITDELIKLDGIYDKHGKPVIDKKTGLPKVVEDPEWILFLKCIRGDKTDNVFSAYPGARIKGTKNKVGLREAFEDRNKQGYAWNNLMLQRWVDPDEVEHKVLTDYLANKQVIDLTEQPEHIIDLMDRAIDNAYKKERKSMVGVWLLKFCNKYELVNIAKYPDNYADYMNAPLPKLHDDT